jgi:hypothetical protein
MHGTQAQHWESWLVWVVGGLQPRWKEDDQVCAWYYRFQFANFGHAGLRSYQMWRIIYKVKPTNNYHRDEAVLWLKSSTELQEAII